MTRQAMTSTSAKTSTKKAASTRGPAKKTSKTFLAMIQEAIKGGEDAKKGISRAAIKKFVASKYHIDFKDRTKVNSLNRAITKGIADKELKNGRTSGTFRLGDKAGQKPKKARKPRTPKEPKVKAAKSSDAEPKPAKEAKPKTVRKRGIAGSRTLKTMPATKAATEE